MFYNNKLEKAKKYLKDIGEDTSVLDSYEYKNVDIYPYTDENEISENAQRAVLSYIYNHGVTEVQLEE